MKDKVLIYGASGYMGKLFTKYAKDKHLPMVLGSRKPFKTTEALRVFSLEDIAQVAAQLHDVKLVVNLAGPFVFSQAKFIEACLKTGTHYIDIAGEAPEFELAYQFEDRAKKAGIMLMPGAGFGVVPTDIAAKLAQEKLPEATHLTLSYFTQGTASRGTLKTVLKDINKSGIKIVDGKKIEAKPAQSDYYLEVEGKKQRLVYNPWRGDLFTAKHSSKILNIETYSNFPSFVEKMMKGRLLWLRNLILNRLINLLPEGPSESGLKKGKTYVQAKVSNGHREEKISISGPEAYVFTAQTLTSIALAILAEEWQAGFQTPSIYGVKILKKDFNNVHIH